MILFMLLFMLLFFVIAIFCTLVLGTGFIVIFGDAIICAMIVTFIIKAFRKKK
jgi:hypothetical protein